VLIILKGAMQGRVLAEAADSLLQRVESLPVAWMLGRPDGCHGDSVAPDDLAVGRMAAEYPVSRNHRHLAFLNPKPNHVLFVRRQMSFEWHARQLDATVGCFLGNSPNLWQLPLHPVDSVQTVQVLLGQLLDSQPRPTAVFCPADSITRQLYKACAMGGIEPGRDLSIISASFEDASAMLHPTLTSIDIHPDAIGRCTVELLEWRLAHPDEREVQITIAPSLVEGQSVRDLPAEGTD